MMSGGGRGFWGAIAVGVVWMCFGFMAYDGGDKLLGRPHRVLTKPFQGDAIEAKYKDDLLSLRLIDKQIVGTRGGLNGRKLKKEPARRSISARWEPCGKVLARIKYRPPDRLADLIQKVIIEEILVCPAAEYTDITTLLLQRLIRDWGARTRWIQINKVTLGKRNWLWQAIQSASTNTSSGFYVEGDQYANATQVRLGKLRNAFRRHVTVPVRLMPSDSPKWPKGIKGTGYTADYLKPITDIQKARVRKKKILRKLHKKKFHGVN